MDSSIGVLLPDVDLMDLVAEVVRPVPPRVEASGRAVYTWRTVDTDLTALLGPTRTASGETPCPQPPS
jgi:hypothetical protein